MGTTPDKDWENLPLINLPVNIRRPIDVRAEDGKVRMYVTTPNQPDLALDLGMSAQGAILLAMDLMRAAKQTQPQTGDQ